MNGRTRNFQDRFLRVERIIQETPETKSFVLDPAGEPMSFAPGQFVNVTATLEDSGRVRRAYSIASSPLDPELMLTVKRMQNGLLSTRLCDLVKPGDLLHIRGPHGVFTLDESAGHCVFIAGGSGIVPFRSMWRYIRQSGSATRIELLYASKSLEYVIYRKELDELIAAGVRIIHTFTRNQNPAWTGLARRIDQEMLVQTIQTFSEKLFYICGPPAMCDCVVKALYELGVQRDRIRVERYD